MVLLLLMQTNLLLLCGSTNYSFYSKFVKFTLCLLMVGANMTNSVCDQSQKLLCVPCPECSPGLMPKEQCGAFWELGWTVDIECMPCQKGLSYSCTYDTMYKMFAKWKTHKNLYQNKKNGLCGECQSGYYHSYVMWKMSILLGWRCLVYCSIGM